MNLKKMSYKEDDSSQKFEISKRRLEHLWNKIKPDIWVARILYVELNVERSVLCESSSLDWIFASRIYRRAQVYRIETEWATKMWNCKFVPVD